ncbi:FadR/GntR family transcriptional regulator [Mycobacteroides abscessus]|uniref:FadR/GntR family transcriptional regulator n=1 Tax=Mycobacteroides abscessus TaxID=36809 RepID=UPI0009269068|nr:FadR/GntR family transcriptional regulator [Mycobacteroides abscessus]MDO3333912.1 FadR/GntR family transcriptional regulator [Mycobacteroides abscessus subsp. bolletii]QSM86876.1 FadR family transcriptional regulator [Mycobacteroides abscessus subsp. bolletii]SIB89673.1 FadR family transcriptional regulator [Mycobacteroides abscessus subsp. bolletii]SKS87934.1 FadR family transcriptional regulator [Mycobacteroides abscessus subsp. bolletii]SKT11140.1 FadR family transcriptional regulator [
MTTLGVGRESRRRLTSPRIAETVADELRRQIVDGELADGDLLPPQAVLVERFNVSLVSLREALRILETEGLVSVRRGNQGGAYVHAPTKNSAAYMLGLVLQSEHVLLSDLGRALRDLEPTCAALAAQREDRGDTVVPELTRLNDAMSDNIADGPAFTDLGRQFHDALVRGCGNATVVAVVGSLESLWSGHEQRWAQRSASTGAYPSPAERRAVHKAHTALTAAIENGDPERARKIATRHLADTQTYVLSDDATQRIIATSPSTMASAKDWRSH